MNDFKQKILNFQERGDRTIIEEILSAVELNFMRDYNRHRVKDGTISGGIRINLGADYKYIAYRIRAMRELLMRHISIEYTDGTRYLNDFQRYLSIIYIDFNIKFKAAEIYDQDYYMYYFTITKELCDELTVLLPRLQKMFESHEYRHFIWMLERFKKAEEDVREVKAERMKEIMDVTVYALEYALKYVDVKKSEKEIVKYINMTFTSKLSDAEIKRNGLRRLQRKSNNGKRVSYLVKPYFPKNNYEVIFGFDISDRLWMLSQEQREFLSKVSMLIDVDRKAGNTSNYSCINNGDVRIRRKYIATKLDIREDLVRQKIARIKKKVI